MSSNQLSPTTNSYCCEICGQEDLDDCEIRTHMQEVHVNGAISCPFCDLCDISADEMLLHVNSAHLDFLSPSSTTTEGVVGIQDENSTRPKVEEEEKEAACCAVEVLSNSHIQFTTTKHERRPARPTLYLKESVEGRRSTMHQPEVQSTCPMCDHRELSPVLLEQHINRCHFDLTSPSKFPEMDDCPMSGTEFVCPLCSRCFHSVDELQLHVNVEHILSPVSTPPSSVTTMADKRDIVRHREDENANLLQKCPVCEVDFATFTDVVQMARHVDDHFKVSQTAKLVNSPVLTGVQASIDCFLAREIDCQEREVRRSRECHDFQKLKAQYGMDGRGSFHDQSLTNMQRAVYNGELSVDDFYNRQVQLKAAEMSGVDDGNSCTKGILPKIRAAVMSCNRVAAVWLCSIADHYGTTYGDRGWGCGYRNIQMMLSSLMHHTGYNEKLFNGKNSMPSISKIQELIERSWRDGFDLQGCEQLGGSLSNTRKWIGASEVVSLLSSFRIRCQLVDFHRPTGPDGSHPELFKWIANYFQKPEDFKAPLYLQHQGHSRTVVGVEQLKDGCLRMLIFDPSHNRRQLQVLIMSGGSIANGMQLLRRPLSALKAKQYQVVAINGIIDTDCEFNQRKIHASIRIP